MTRRQMLNRIRMLGGLNKKTALQVSIEKWKNITKYWEQMWEDQEKAPVLVDENKTHLPGMSNCGLCELYYGEPKKICPLNINKEDYCEGDCNENYRSALYGLKRKDYELFEEAAQALVKIMEDL